MLHCAYFFYIYYFVHICMYVCMYRHQHDMACAWRSEDKVWGLVLFLPLCDSWRSDSGCQTWCRAILLSLNWTLTPGGRTEGYVRPRGQRKIPAYPHKAPFVKRSKLVLSYTLRDSEKSCCWHFWGPALSRHNTFSHTCWGGWPYCFHEGLYHRHRQRCDPRHLTT